MSAGHGQSRLSKLASGVRAPEVMNFLVVGGIGYAVDVAAFNLMLRGGMGSMLAKTLAVAVATVVTYLGNRTLTWSGDGRRQRRREVFLFALFNVIGLGFSIVCLYVSHHLMGLTSPLADNISANVIGLALGTAFRFWTYRTVVFAPAPEQESEPALTRDPVARSADRD